MIRTLTTKNIGPGGDVLETQLAPRLTLLTGEKASGKTFLLDCLWRAVSGSWAADSNPQMRCGMPAIPTRGLEPAHVLALTDDDGVERALKTHWDTARQQWDPSYGRHDGVAVHAHADGSVSTWCGWTKSNNGRARSLPAEQAWNGEAGGGEEAWPGLAGLVQRWSGGNDKTRIRTADRAVTNLVPSATSKRGQTGGAARMLTATPRPTAAIARWTTIAMAVAWAWSEADDDARRHGLLLLIDDIETHLHPRWQREAIERTRSLQATVLDNRPLQLVATTRAPLILGSTEPWFDHRQDLLMLIKSNRTMGRATVEPVPFVRHGTVGQWLTSDVFGLETDRGSIEAEQAMLATGALLDDGCTDRETLKHARDRLRALLGDTDPFWVRWNARVANREKHQQMEINRSAGTHRDAGEQGKPRPDDRSANPATGLTGARSRR